MSGLLKLSQPPLPRGAEAWLMELIGKGTYAKGAVWVATKVPDGAVLAHANQARTTTFARDDPENVLYAPDVVSFAKKIGLYPEDAPDADFDFSAAYDPVTFSGARHGEARVWDIYRRVVGPEAMEPYADYARGFNLTNRMPLFVYPAATAGAAGEIEKKLSVGRRNDGTKENSLRTLEDNVMHPTTFSPHRKNSASSRLHYCAR